ncbi:hypothetical protein WMY93_026041 [Mugilogobius chulae]|uniref:Z-binding domain-containing protein n=1 Tax=Mugilogobius chulae TaxID=88201 RepID=A0AAW0N226_9GOBI
MSRGRGGSYNKHYFRYPSPYGGQGRDDFYRPGPSSPFPQVQYHNYLSSPRGPAPPYGFPSTPPQNFNPNHGGLSQSFRQQQADFLRGQSSEAPEFRPAGRGSSGFPNQQHNRFANPNTSQRGRGSQGQRLRQPQSVPGPRQVHPSHLQANTNTTPFHNRPWCATIDPLCNSFQNLSIQREQRKYGDKPNRYPPSRSSGKDSIALTPDIQEQVHKALAALKPDERIPAKLLAKKLHLPKKIVNKALYSLEQSQKACKEGLLPPEWSLCREAPPPLCNRSEDTLKPEKDSQLNSKSTDQEKDEDSDVIVESSCSSSCSSLDSDEESESESQDIVSSSADSIDLTMACQKEDIFNYLLDAKEATSLSIAKNLGLRGAKQVNPTLYALEKQGEVVKNSDVTPPTFRLFDEKKDVLVLLFLEEISSNQLTPFYRMRKLVRSRTYLSWTQARSHKGLFWENVRRALECGNEPGDNHNPLA